MKRLDNIFFNILISALFGLTVLYWLFFIPLFEKLENGEKKKRDKQAEVLEKVKFHKHTFDNYFESLNQIMSVGLMMLLQMKQLSF